MSDFTEPDWPHLLCELRCGALADCLLDEAPYCLACADLLVERLELVHAYPRLRETLAPLLDGVRV